MGQRRRNGSERKVGDGKMLRVEKAVPKSGWMLLGEKKIRRERERERVGEGRN